VRYALCGAQGPKTSTCLSAWITRNPRPQRMARKHPRNTERRVSALAELKKDLERELA
jgi:hypothetical protein